MIHRAAAVLSILGALTLALATGAGAQSLNTYDAFGQNPAEIHPFKWRGQESQFFQTLGVRDTEITRRLTNGQFQAALRSFGGVGTDAGIAGAGRSRILVNHPALTDGDPAITAIQVRVTPKAAVAQDCAANTGQGTARATVSAFFFNDGTGNATAGDLFGDIIAGVNIERNSKLGDRIVAFVSRCDQPPCQTANALKFFEFTRADWKINKPELVTVLWRKATKDFRFTVTRPSTSITETKVLTYGDLLPFDGERPKNGVFVSIGVQNNPLNCATGRKEASFDALFDGFKLNADAVAATN